MFEGIDTNSLLNAVGVLQDVDTYWDAERHQEVESRYSYQYAILSASDYTDNAKTYALVHGIYPIPLNGLPFLQSILEELRASGLLLATITAFLRESMRLVSRFHPAFVACLDGDRSCQTHAPRHAMPVPRFQQVAYDTDSHHKEWVSNSFR